MVPPRNSKNNVIWAPAFEGGPTDGSNLAGRSQYHSKLSVHILVHYEHGIILNFLNENVSAKSYHALLTDKIFPKLRLYGQEEFARFWWWEDGCPGHQNKEVSALLKETFDSQVIAGRFNQWNGIGIDAPPKSCDLSILDFFINNEVKTRVWNTEIQPNNLEELKERIKLVISEIPSDQIKGAFHSMKERVNACYQAFGGHFVHKKG